MQGFFQPVGEVERQSGKPFNVPTYYPAALFPSYLYPAWYSDEVRQSAPISDSDPIHSLGTTTSPYLPVVERATVRVAAFGGQLSEAEMRAVLAEAGAPAEWVAPLLAIAWCESRYSPYAVGDGGNSLGAWQLWRGWFRPGEDPFDVLTNARVALRVREMRGRFGGAGGWSCADRLGIR